ncbi:MAG: NADP-dependent malic enzyme [Candidatus Competibacteraceae bacterium]|jgi:malate dehydrogenase (oxaloacetate-decarboxylating)(NADP+)|nr:NADP-dependent malic enzyme [Candidatus Competibacteraceae bacterium]
MSDELKESALQYHRNHRPGKLAIIATKPLATQRDLALAYSPGVAAACEAIVGDPQEAAQMTARGNLVAVISNGTAVLGLGNIGPLAAKPVMEGKAVLFKKFADIDVFDIELDADDPARFIEIVAGLEPTFGGINLEDVKAPECFEVEQTLRKRMKIPVFHDDQHGTAIIVGAAVTNGLRVVDKDIAKVKLVASGAGAAALACLNLLVSLGLPRENITVTDLAGVVYQGRTELMDPWKAVYAQDTRARTLAEAIEGADIFLGLSAGGVLKPAMLENMAENPLILALANPVPEIMPEEAKAVRPDAIIATGRSDYPNQVNNVLCFPYIFRGALDVGATTINEEMKLACVRALADLAMAEPSEVVTKAYGGQPMRFGPDYLIPKPFDPRLIVQLAPATAKAAMDSGVATRPIQDFETYTDRLTEFVFKSGMVMKPIFARAKHCPKRLVYAEGEDRRVLQATQQVIDERIAWPILVGRPAVIEDRIQELGLRMKLGQDFEVINPLQDERFQAYWSTYHEIMGRHGISPENAKVAVRTNATVVAALALRRRDADAMLCGANGRFGSHIQIVRDVIGKWENIHDFSTMSALIMPSGTYFICDSHVTPDPSVEELVEMTLLAADEVSAFGLTPKVALLSRSNFGTYDTASSLKMREAATILRNRAPNLEVDGEMNADVALSEELRNVALPNARLKGQANLLIMPTVDAAHIAFNMLRILGNGVSVGPILIGAAQPVHVVTHSISVRGLVNMSAMSVVQAQLLAEERAVQ